MRDVEADRTCGSDGSDAHSIQDGPRHDGDERDVETNTSGQNSGQGGQEREQVRSDDIEGDWRCENDSNCVGFDGIRARMDGTTNVVCSDPKRVDTRTLAGYASSQHGCNKRTTANVPGSPTPLGKNPRRPTDNPNPPRRRGKLKTSTTSVSQTRPCERTYHTTWTRRSRTGRLIRDKHTLLISAED